MKHIIIPMMGCFSSSWVVVVSSLLMIQVVVLIIALPARTAEEYIWKQQTESKVGSPPHDLPGGFLVMTPTPSEEGHDVLGLGGLEKQEVTPWKKDDSEEKGSGSLQGLEDSEEKSSGSLLGKALETGYSFCHAWQDFRLLLSSLLGFLLTHFVSISIGPPHGPHGSGSPSTRDGQPRSMGGWFVGQDRRFKLYCYAM